jgi:hypothetical protein
MRLKQFTDKLQHSSIILGAHDHHPEPYSVSFSNTTQSLPPGTTYDLNIPLGRTGYKTARVQMTGKAVTSVLWRECAELVVTTSAAEAMGHSVRKASTKKVYSATYSKQNSNTYLTHKIFDDNIGSSSRYICVQDAIIIGSNLRITFKNNYGGSATLWVKGQVIIW